MPASGYGGPDASFLERLRHLVLPALALGIVSSALITRFTRASMLDVLNDDYVRTARSKGMGEWGVVMKHAFKNALIPVLTVVGLTAALLISGAVVTETVFSLPGIGNLVVSAVLRRDYPVIQGALLVIAALYVLINFLIDMLYLAIDPRVRYWMAASSAPVARPRLASLILQRKTLLIGLIVLAVIALLAILAPLIAPYSPSRLSVVNRLKPPSERWFFGTDEFGRDVFSRTIYAGQLSLLVGAAATVLAAVLGITLGLVAGFFRKLDGVIARIIDAMMAFPDILLAISLVAALGPSLATVIVALGIVYAPRLARIVRASTLIIRELPYVEAARALGVPTWKIMTRHVLRNLVSPILVQATFIFAYAMLAEASLSFLGVGVSPEIPTWGTMIAGGRQYIGQADWMMLFPGAAIVLTVLSLQLVGDGLRDLLDPRLRKDL